MDSNSRYANRGNPQASPRFLAEGRDVGLLALDPPVDLPAVWRRLGIVRQADLVIAAVGRPEMVKGDWVKTGAGQAAKICNNMILGATMIATCEAFALAEKLGLDLQTFFDISSKASGQSWSMTSYCPVPGVGPQSPADNQYQGGFAAALMLKDLKLAMEAAQGAGAQVPMGQRAEELYAQFAEAGNGGLDFSAIIKTL